jgi:hypothetical protein
LRIKYKTKKAFRIAFGAALSCFFAAEASAQTISYLIPDIGAPGMNTYIEIIGPHDKTGNYGADGFYLNNPGDAVEVVCLNPADSQIVRFGPCVVSWNGRMVSTQAFVLPGATPDTWDWQRTNLRIPIQVLVNGSPSNVDSFYIIAPQHIGELSAPGSLGSGGNYGVRSRRGAMIVDSLILTGNGKYTVSTEDCDPITPGNQGYLPCVVITIGKISIGNSANISISATRDAGPGGGGGGAGGVDTAGFGFCAGGSNCIPPQNLGNVVLVASGVRDTSLNHVPGGGGDFCDQGGGGGTGHPFGLSGAHGIGDKSPAGGYGGGTAGGENWVPPNIPAYGGGGGGNASAGSQGDGLGNNAGSAVGNKMLVPLTGGSGGGAGNEGHCTGGSGGGGGGGLSLYSTSPIFVSALFANGGKGFDGTTVRSDPTGPPGGCAGGGGGSGGNLIFGSHQGIAGSQTIQLKGGLAGKACDAYSHVGGVGAQGRLREDGLQVQTASVSPTSATQYHGPSTDTSSIVFHSFTLTGTGNGSQINIYLRPLSGIWYKYATIANYNTPKWSTQIYLNAPDSIYLLAAAQEVPTPSVAQYTAEPALVLSQVAANILRVEDCASTLTEPQRDTAGGTVKLRVRLGGNNLANRGKILHVFLHFNTDLLSPDSVFAEDCNTAIDSVRAGSVRNDGADYYVYYSSSLTSGFDTACVALNLLAKVMVSDSVTTLVSVDSIISQSTKGQFPLSICSGSKFDRIPACGDSAFIRVMQGQPPFEVTLITPNPAHDEVRILLQIAKDAIVNFEIDDLLGRTVLRKAMMNNEFLFRVGQMPIGPAFLRFESNGYVRTRRFLITK